MTSTLHSEVGTARPTPAVGRDEQLLAAARNKLRASGYLLLGTVICEVVDGIITVRGSVPTFYLKQVAQEVLLQVASDQGVRNRLEVRGPGREAWD
jgi:hypothetical protein